MQRPIRQRLVEGLEKRGWVRDPDHATRKYWVFKPSAGMVCDGRPETSRIFVGPAGALRGCKSGRVGVSTNMPRFKARLLREVK